MYLGINGNGKQMWNERFLLLERLIKGILQIENKKKKRKVKLINKINDLI